MLLRVCNVNMKEKPEWQFISFYANSLQRGGNISQLYWIYMNSTSKSIQKLRAVILE